MLINLSLIGVIVCAALFIIAAFDFITYVFKSAPKRAMFSRKFWLVGTIAGGILAYWYFNGLKFI